MVVVLAFYAFSKVENPQDLVKAHFEFLEERNARGRIYINEEGINGQMSIAEEYAEEYMSWLKSHEPFKDLEFKIHTHPEHAFAKLTVKYRDQLVALDHKVDISKTAKHVSPQKWKSMLSQKDPDTIVIDVRNDYEWEVGHFEGAKLPKFKTFREFKEYAKGLKNNFDRSKTKVMMYCTGGIRCEVYSCLLKDEGFDNIYQLDGGVIKYGIEEGDDHWEGNLFVFDDRMVVPVSPGSKQDPISKCCFCKEPADTYYNCANMDCNELFIACSSCVSDKKGCCSEPCETKPRVRPFEPQERPKPFRKLPFEEKQKLTKQKD